MIVAGGGIAGVAAVSASREGAEEWGDSNNYVTLRFDSLVTYPVM